MKQGEHKHVEEDAIVCCHRPCPATCTMDGMRDVVVGNGQDEELHDGSDPPHHEAVPLIDGG